MPDYSKLTDDEFDFYLYRIVEKLSVSSLMAIPGVYEVLHEELNDEVLDAWVGDQPEEDTDPLADDLCDYCMCSGVQVDHTSHSRTICPDCAAADADKDDEEVEAEDV